MQTNPNIVPTPKWIHDLIVYEIATKSFTSPHGPESGTFNSLKEKAGYLRDLGITGVWLTGHQLCNPVHFYNIWTEYACIRPDQLDPSLGTPVDFKEMIEAFHRVGIKIFLDVITHGLMSDSQIVKEKPHWFKGGSWGMIDFDWFGNHEDLDEWWVNTWVDYVREYQIDGFRLDVATYRPDLWSLIRKKAAALGHPIVIIPETGPSVTGVSDFLQHGTRISEQCIGLSREHRLFKDVAGFMTDTVNRVESAYRVKVVYEDGSIGESHTGKFDSLAVIFEDSSKELKNDAFGHSSYIEHKGVLRIENLALGKKISDIIIYDPENHEWHEKDFMMVDYSIKREGEAPSIKLQFPFRQQDGQYLSIQLSCHDNGWDSFPVDENPYAAQGSRFAFGYGFMLAPAVPIFMSGEEFNADFVPLPQLSPNLYGNADFGKGRWLYGSWIQWDQLEADQAKREMLEDVKKMIAIRKQEVELIHPFQVGIDNTLLLKVDFESAEAIPVPYLYCGAGKMILVAGNSNVDSDVKVNFKLPERVWEKFAAEESMKITDLWNNKEIGTLTADEFARSEWTIRKDKVVGGGVLVLKIEKL